MAPLPKRRHAIKRGRMRRDAAKLVKTGLIRCSSCQKLIRSHLVCPYCGSYNGQVITVKKEKKKKHEETQ